jgi:hypothetical protein
MEINQQEGEWIATMTYPETHEIDGSPSDHAVAAVAQEYAVNRSQIAFKINIAGASFTGSYTGLIQLADI